ncbi:hypothetical protein [Marinibacterium sp. SX1]|uniref:hypothetical protein n=1 Tax=Marinibacterium sp. SX1 TaxID=3388424 RepID=UPI003D166E5C
MPELIKTYLRQCAIGFGIAAVFVTLLLGFNVANLRGLIFGSDIGLLALFMLWFFNGIVFAGVQFGIYVMSMAERDDNGRGMGIPDYLPVRVRAERARTPLNRAMQRRDR